MTKPHLGFRVRTAEAGYYRELIGAEMLRIAAKRVPIIGGNSSGRPYGLALLILTHWFGKDWFVRYIDHESKRRNFMNKEQNPLDDLLSMRRVINLAEMLINLQTVRGIDSIFEDLYYGKLESAFAELEVGKLLYRKRVNFRYVWPNNVLGESFDLVARFTNGRIGCGEVKAKMEGAKPSKAGILSRLNEARRQLPKIDFPGIIFVKLPNGWMDGNAMTEMAMEAAVEFFRGTARIVSVVFLYSVDQQYKDTVHTWLHSLEVVSDGHRFGKDLKWRITTDHEPKNREWVDLGEVCETATREMYSYRIPTFRI